MRERKFRAWHENGKIDRNLIHSPGMIFDERPGECIKWYLDRQKIIDIMEFIGLYDINKKEIYEKDIVTGNITDQYSSSNIPDFIGIIEWDEFDTGYYINILNFKECKITYLKIYYAENLKIVGNFYENKDILEACKKGFSTI